MINESFESKNQIPINLSQETRRLIAYEKLVDNLGSAACKEMGIELFFELELAKIREAKKICENCEIKDLCLDFAILNEEIYGIWGGTTPNERFKIARTRRLL